jgi:DNA-binding NtrC family response regulator
MTDKRGLFEAASGGWIFLDEVATLSPAAQVALLRVLEANEVMRVGSTKPVTVKVRVLAATNEPIEQMVKDGRFRRDLWQRLREAEIALPPLRDRPAEIRPLVEHFCRVMSGGPYTPSGPVMEVLTNVSWREGNVRELRNCLRAMTELHVNKLLTPLAIPARIWEEAGERPKDGPAAGATPLQGTKDASAVSIPWHGTYDDMADMLLIEMTRRFARGRTRQIPLRELAELTGLARSTLSGRFQAIRHKNLVDFDELTKIVNVGDKKV